MPPVWPYWVGQQVQVQNVGTGASAWYAWVQTGTTATTYADPWTAWQAQGTVGTAQITYPAQQCAWSYWQTTPQPVYTAPPPEPTAEELARRKRADLIRRTRQRAFQVRRNIAERRARELLLTHLDERQREEYIAERAFHVETADGRRRYRIAYGLAGNVRLVKCEGEPPVGKYGRPVWPGARFCMHAYHPDGPVPNEDNVLAQKLLLEANEREFLALANVS